MFQALAAIVAFCRWLAFGPEPLPDQVAAGRALCAQGKGIERTLRDDRAVIGVWFDGRIKDDVESMIWISPRMASRWLGYLQEQEKETWPPGEMQRRWDAIRSFVGARLCFVVRLSAMPRLRGLDMASEGVPSAADIDHPEFLLTSGPGYAFPKPSAFDRILRGDRSPWLYPKGFQARVPLPEPVRATEERLLARWQARDRGRLEKYVWFQDLPVRDAFSAKGQTFERDAGYGLGDYGSAWYWVAFDLSRMRGLEGGFDVWVLTPNKERVGSFRFK